MNENNTPLPLASRYSSELNLLEQVHMALGSASKLDDFYVIMASLLVDPNTFGYSRAFFLRYDDRSGVFTGKLAIGAVNQAEHEQFHNNLIEEANLLRSQIEEIQRDSPEPRAVQPLYDLKYHSLWIQLLQGLDEGTSLQSGFQELAIKRDELPENHILERAAAGSHALIFEPPQCGLDGLEDFVRLPAIAGRLITKRGINGILIADKIYEGHPLDDEALYHFQWLLNHASVTLDNVEMVEELTETTKRLQEVDRIKTNFLSIVSHELRTPLTSIIGFVHLLYDEKAGPVSATQKDLLKRVTNHSMHLQSMVNDLLEIAEVEGGGMINVSLQPVDPLAAFMNVLPKIEARRGGKRVDIHPVIRDKIPLIRADKGALERIFYHLMDNAVKFIQTSGRVTVDFTEHEGMLDIGITDTGIGIPQENLQRIFDHFYQIDFRLERAYGGMGIGLTIVKLLLKATDGQIHVESNPGAGSRFILTYPVFTGENAY